MRPTIPIPALITALIASLATAGRAQLPPPPVPPENPITAQKAVLGKMLFWEEQLSSDDSMACGTCHSEATGGGDPRLVAAPPIHPGPDGTPGTADDIVGSHGVVRSDANRDYLPDPTFGLRRQVTRRRAPTHIAAAYSSPLLWDGGATDTFVDPATGAVVVATGGALESQVLGPILSPAEMGHDGRTWTEVTGKLARIRPMALATGLTADIRGALATAPRYPDLFAAAFGDPAITATRIALALATYQRTLVPDQTPWDRFERGEITALTPDQQIGLNVFLAEGRCRQCHPPPLFADGFHNLGIRPPHEDLGLQRVTGDPADRGKFKTPTLRNVGLRLRGLHNGSMPQVGDPAFAGAPQSMVEFYWNGGGPFLDNKSPLLLSLQAQGVPRQSLLWVEDFVQNGLTDPRVAAGLPPFDRPTLASERPGSTDFGVGLPGSTGTEPFVVHTAPAFVGNDRFKLGLAGGPGGASAILAVASHPVTPPLWFGAVPVNIDPLMVWEVFTLSGRGPDGGHATFHLPIPEMPVLAGLRFYAQSFAFDPGAAVGVAASAGVEVPILR